MIGQHALHDDNLSLQRGVVATATASDLGDSFQYAIEQPVTISRQKSALLPIVNKSVEGEKVSLYSPQVHAKYPLLALRLKNTSGVHLMQGPVAVFEGNGYAGDTQMPDLPSGKQRLVSYAVDLGTEVEAKSGDWTGNLTKVCLHKGQFISLAVKRGSTTYSITNRSPHDRVVLVEHPRSGDYRLLGKDKPCEQTPDIYRFEKKVPAGQSVHFEVVQEQDVDNSTPLTNVPLEAVQWLLKCELSNPAVKSALEKLQQFQTTLQKTGEENFRLQQQLQTIRADQDRLRANLKEMPATSAVHKRYLEKFDKQETEIEKLQEQGQEVAARSQKQLEAMTTFANDLNVEATIRKAAPMPQAPTTWMIPGRSMQ
jgi:hypothetical protein